MAKVTTEASAKSALGGSVLEALTGIGAVVLAIIGLANVARYGMAGAATIVVGAALVLEGGAVLARMRAMRRHETSERAQMGGPAGIAILGGITGIVLGAFALADFTPLTLIPIAIIVFGGSLVFASIGTARVHVDVGEEVAPMAPSFELLAGIAAVTLGILALLDFAPLVLSLIALLAVGAAVLLSGSAIGARMGLSWREEQHYGRSRPVVREERHYEAGPEHRHA